jgi:hypothetical protein
MGTVDTSTVASGVRQPATARRLDRAETVFALAAFAALCAIALSFAPRLVEPDDHAYQASIVGITQGHWLTLSTAQAQALGQQLGSPAGGVIGIQRVPNQSSQRTIVRSGPGGVAGAPGASPITQWVQLPSGRWISEKDPGYPFLAAAFQALGIIRLAPLFYGALGCLGLFFGARRWLGRFGGGAAVGLFCTSGAALLFAWRDYMPTFTDASLIAAGTGALLWAILPAEPAEPAEPAKAAEPIEPIEAAEAAEPIEPAEAAGASVRWRTWVGLAGFVALEAAAFTRYTDVVVLGCAAVAVVVAWRLRKVPTVALAWWLGSVAVFGVGVAVFDDLVYGGPLKSGYQPGEIQFRLSAIGPNLRYMPAHLLEAMPMLVLALAAVVWIIARWARLRARLRRVAAAPAAGARRDHAVGLAVEARRDYAVGFAAGARRDLAVGLALTASWFSVWGLYAAYTWTANGFVTTLQSARFYVPAIGAIALLGAWLLVRVPRRSSLAAATSVVAVAALFGLGVWSFGDMRVNQGPGMIRNQIQPGGVIPGAVPGSQSGTPQPQRP